MVKNISYLLIATWLLSSCSATLTPFTQSLYDKYQWSEDELRNIQFYLSDDIRLYRDIGNAESTINNGKIKVVNGREVEEVIFKKGTPGVFTFSPKSERFGVSFDTGEGEKFLMFGPNEKMSGRYVLLAKEWEKRIGKVTYDGKIYQTDAQSAMAILLVDIKKINKSKYNTTVAKGRKIEG